MSEPIGESTFPKIAMSPLRIEVARGDAVLRGYLCKVESVGRVDRVRRRSYDDFGCLGSGCRQSNLCTR
jgi:hypothetical protein